MVVDSATRRVELVCASVFGIKKLPLRGPSKIDSGSYKVPPSTVIFSKRRKIITFDMKGDQSMGD